MEQLAKLNSFYGKNRYIVNGLLAIGGIVVLYYIAKGAIRVATRGSGFNAGEQESNETGSGQGASASTQGATITSQQAQSLATKLWNAMKGANDDEKAIYDAFAVLQNNADVAMVVSAFGVRPYMGVLGLYGGEPNSFDKFMGNYDDLDLSGWLRNDTSRTDSGSGWDMESVWSKMESAGYYI